MIQNTIALIIVAMAALITLYSLYKAITVKDKSVCGGCASCEIKNELKKKGKLMLNTENPAHPNYKFSPVNLKYTMKERSA